MHKKNFLIYFFIFNFFLFENLSSKIENSIIVKIDKKIITNFDVKNKILSSLIISGNEISQENINNLKGQILENLINLKLKEIELDKLNLKVSKAQIDNYFSRVSGNKPQKLIKDFKENGVNYQLFINEIETELNWQQFIFNKYSSKINIDEKIIEEEVRKVSQSGFGSKEFNISEIEIFQNINISNEKNISFILDEIKKNGFENTALKLSISGSSSKKGELGWISEKSLNQKILDILNNLQPGQVSNPIIQANSILFLKLNSKRTTNSNELDREKLKRNIIRQKQNEMFNLVSNSHLSKLRNNYLIQYIK